MGKFKASVKKTPNTFLTIVQIRETIGAGDPSLNNKTAQKIQHELKIHGYDSVVRAKLLVQQINYDSPPAKIIKTP